MRGGVKFHLIKVQADVLLRYVSCVVTGLSPLAVLADTYLFLSTLN